jgi:hypothetical protein
MRLGFEMFHIMIFGLVMPVSAWARGDQEREVERVEGIYQVPLPEGNRDESLIIAADFPVTYKITRQTGRPLKISYDLPETLTGLPNDVELRQVDEEANVWQGLKAEEIQCAEDLAELACTIRYTGLDVDAALAGAAIEKAFADTNQLDARMQTMRRFQSEPIGVVRIPWNSQKP